MASFLHSRRADEFWVGVEADVGEVVGLVLTHEEAAVRFHFRSRKNEPILAWFGRGIVLDSIVFVEFEKGGGLFQGAGLAVSAVGLEGAELVERFVELAGEALRVHAEGGEGAVGVGDGEPVLARDQAGFEQRDSVLAPGGVREFLDEVGFGGRLWLVLIAELLAVKLVGGGVFGGQDGGAAGESMGDRVLRRAVLAFGRARAGGTLRVRAVGGRAGVHERG